MKGNLKIVVNSYGDPTHLVSLTERLPKPNHKQVRVRVLAAGVGWADIMARRGGYPLASKPPFTPGYDFTGVIDEIGSEVTDFNVGDHVVGLNPNFGCYSEYLCISSDFLVRFPKYLDPAEVCSLCLNYLTAHCMLFKKANIQPGQTILVHSAAGGVGSALVQLANLAGVKVLGTASHQKHDVVRRLGATHIDYQSLDFVEEVHAHFPEGVDAAFDPIGGEHLSRSYKALKRDGVLVSYGFSGKKYGGLFAMASGIAQVALLNMLPSRKKVLFCALPSQVKKDVIWYKEALTSLVKSLDRGRINPIITEIIPLEQASKAHQLLESGSTVGKIVLKCSTFPNEADFDNKGPNAA